jgi:hypothetical protein
MDEFEIDDNYEGKLNHRLGISKLYMNKSGTLG